MSGRTLRHPIWTTDQAGTEQKKGMVIITDAEHKVIEDMAKLQQLPKFTSQLELQKFCKEAVTANENSRIQEARAKQAANLKALGLKKPNLPGYFSSQSVQPA